MKRPARCSPRLQQRAERYDRERQRGGGELRATSECRGTTDRGSHHAHDQAERQGHQETEGTLGAEQKQTAGGEGQSHEGDLPALPRAGRVPPIEQKRGQRTDGEGGPEEECQTVLPEVRHRERHHADPEQQPGRHGEERRGQPALIGARPLVP
jgi:hypothetical protein